MARTNTTQRKALKGTVAAVAGVAILLGGFGTWAEWKQEKFYANSSATVTTGVLKVTFDDTLTSGVFMNAGRAVDRAVPGDVLTRTDTAKFSVTQAVGDNLKFDVVASVDKSSVTNPVGTTGMNVRVSEISIVTPNKGTFKVVDDNSVTVDNAVEGDYVVNVVTELTYDFDLGVNSDMDRPFDISGFAVSLAVNQTEQ